MVSGAHAHTLPRYIVIEVEGVSRAAARKGPMTYALTHEKISSSPSP